MAFCGFPPLCKDFDKYLTKMRLDSLPPQEGDGASETLFKISVLLQRVFPFWLFLILKHSNGVVFNTVKSRK